MHSLSGGPALLRRRAEVQPVLWEVIDRGRAEGAASSTEPPAVVAEGVVGAVLTVIQTRLLAQDSEPPDERPAIELFGSLMSLIVLPYLGAGAARRELTRPAPAPRGAAGDAGARAAALRGSRRAADLPHRPRPAAIAQYPGASNREVAERAGIVDQGQISKLLSRLESGGRDRQPERGHLARRPQRMAPDRARRARRAGRRGGASACRRGPTSTGARAARPSTLVS